MPFTYLAHQIVVVPLKGWRPRWFSGTALAVGSLAPDFEYLRDPAHLPTGIGHSLLGQLTYCLPISIAMVILLSELVVRPFARRLPQGAPYFLDEIAFATPPIRTRSDVLRVVPSILIGSLSHVVLDGLTHRQMWPARVLYPDVMITIGGHSFPLALLLQYGVSAFGILGAALWGHHVLRTRKLRAWASRGDETEARTPGLWALGLVSLAFTITAGFGTRPWLANPTAYFVHARFYVIGFMVFRMISAGLLGLCLSSLVLGLLDRRRARLPALVTPPRP